MKRYAEGDIVEGENPNIDDETRARARKYVEDNMETQEEAPKFTPKSASPAKSKMVTKEELAKSGLSLRDYLNKQQGLTRRGSSASSSAPDTGDETSRLASRYAKPAAKYETSYDRMNRQNRESGVDFDSMVNKIKSRIASASDSGQDRILTGVKKKADENKFMGSTGLKKGGKVSSASRRADGIAIRGKTRI
jgi:hypothetical protein